MSNLVTLRPLVGCLDGRIRIGFPRGEGSLGCSFTVAGKGWCGPAEVCAVLASFLLIRTNQWLSYCWEGSLLQHLVRFPKGIRRGSVLSRDRAPFVSQGQAAGHTAPGPEKIIYRGFMRGG